MPRLGPADVHVNKMLTNVGVRYKNWKYIADQAAPIIDVKNRTNVYPVWDKPSWYRIEVKKRSAGVPAPIIDTTVDLTNSYTCETYHCRTCIDPELRDNADAELDLQARKAELVTDQLMMAREKRVSAAIFATSVWTNQLQKTGTDQWSEATDNPVGDLDTAISTVEDEIGIMPNTIIFGVEPWRVFRRLSEVVDMIFGGGALGPKIVTEEQVAKAFEVSTVLVGRAMYTASLEGTTATYTKIWGKACWIGYVAPNPSMLTPTAILQFRWYYKVRSWMDDNTEEDYIEAKESIDEKVIAAGAGYYLYDVIA